MQECEEELKSLDDILEDTKKDSREKEKALTDAEKNLEQKTKARVKADKELQEAKDNKKKLKLKKKDVQKAVKTAKLTLQAAVSDYEVAWIHYRVAICTLDVIEISWAASVLKGVEVALSAAGKQVNDTIEKDQMASKEFKEACDNQDKNKATTFDALHDSVEASRTYAIALESFEVCLCRLLQIQMDRDAKYQQLQTAKETLHDVNEKKQVPTLRMITTPNVTLVAAPPSVSPSAIDIRRPNLRPRTTPSIGHSSFSPPSVVPSSSSPPSDSPSSSSPPSDSPSSSSPNTLDPFCVTYTKGVLLAREEVTLRLPQDVLTIQCFDPNVSVTVRIINKFTTCDPVGWMQVAYNSGNSPSCVSFDGLLPNDDSFDVTGECVDGVAIFHLFVYDTSPPFTGLYQSIDMGCSFLNTNGSPGEGIAYYRFLVGCSGKEGGLCDLDDESTGLCSSFAYDEK